MGVIYKITSPTGRIYVGQTVNLTRRISLYKTLHCIKQTKLYCSLKKYGFDKHIFEILEECIAEEMSKREKYWINVLNSYYKNNPKGMNMNQGGCVIWDKERINSFADKFRGERNPFYGKKHSKETKRKLSILSTKQMERSSYKISLASGIKGAIAKMKKVITYDNNGNFYLEFNSLSECAKHLNVDITTIRDSLLKDAWVKGKYRCFYKTDNYPLKIKVGKVNYASIKKPILCLDENFEIIFEFESGKSASEFWNIPYGTIVDVSRNNYMMPMKSGHIFIYKDLYKEIMQEVA